MNQDQVINVSHLGKSYRLYDKPIDRLKETLWPLKKRHTIFKALEDITFTVQKGEHIGIVGTNGSGKSTLLQLITGVLAPTSGTVHVNGRIAALLELGAGFNPELSARENVLFQLQLSDIPESKLERKLQEVVEFADIGIFFDQPMRLYSSGMYARVAFAASALVEPDILIVDEALAVGDARFQKKCMDRMHLMKERGVTILVVSHDIFGTKANSSRMILLDKGRIIQDGSPDDVATTYFKLLYPEQTQQRTNFDHESLSVDSDDSSECYRIVPDSFTKKWGANGASLKEMRIYNLQPPNLFNTSNELIIECDYVIDNNAIMQLVKNNSLEKNLIVGIRFDNTSGLVITNFSSALLDEPSINFDISSESVCSFKFCIRLPELAPGTYFLSPGMAIGCSSNCHPIFSYENFASIVCTSQQEVHGIFRAKQSIERIL